MIDSSYDPLDVETTTYFNMIITMYPSIARKGGCVPDASAICTTIASHTSTTTSTTTTTNTTTTTTSYYYQYYYY